MTKTWVKIITVGLFSSITLSAMAEDTVATEDPKRIIVPPVSETTRDIEPDKTFFALPDGRIVSLADWANAVLWSTGTGIVTDPLALDIQNGRMSRLAAGIAVDLENDGTADPAQILSLSGYLYQNVSPEILRMAAGKNSDGSLPGPLMLYNGTGTPQIEHLTPFWQPVNGGGHPIGGLIWLWTLVDGKD